jgi:hypothetical protein
LIKAYTSFLSKSAENSAYWHPRNYIMPEKPPCKKFFFLKKQVVELGSRLATLFLRSFLSKSAENSANWHPRNYIMPENTPQCKKGCFFKKLAAQLRSAWLACYINLKVHLKFFFQK